GDVGGAAGVPAGHVGDGAELVHGEPAAVDADAEHEVAVVELLRLEHRGLAAVDPGAALGVQAVPAEPAAQVGGVDGVEAALAVDVDDALPDVEPVVVLLELLVLVQRLAVAERPLALAARALVVAARGPNRDCHSASFSGGNVRFDWRAARPVLPAHR